MVGIMDEKMEATIMGYTGFRVEGCRVEGFRG